MRHCEMHPSHWSKCDGRRSCTCTRNDLIRFTLETTTGHPQQTLVGTEQTELNLIKACTNLQAKHVNGKFTKHSSKNINK